MSTYLSNFFGLWPRNGEAELAKLREEVQGSMEDNGIDHKPFFPAEKINKLVTKNRVAAVLWRKPSDSLVIFVSQHARKMFLALVCGGVCSVNDLECIMLSCQAHGMTDDKLPVPAMACMGRGDGPQKCTLKHGPWLNVYHDSRWKKLKYGFRRDQCVLNAPVFSDRDFRYELTAECVLPFIWKALDERDGHFSSVFEAILHKDHFVTVCEEGKGDGTKLRRVPSREPLRVALKKMKHLNERGYNVGSAWEHEVLALTEIRELRHKHLIRPLAAIKHGLEHYIMFEWAEGGSLRDFWKSEDETDGYLTPERVMCVLEQLLGLAGALAALHNTNTRTSTGLATRAPSLQPAAGSSRTTTSRPDPSQMLQVPGPVPSIHIQRDSSDDESHRNSDIDRSYASEDLDTELEVHWRHGDLKPDNILRFKDHSSQRWLGTLKIADLGLAKQHFDKTSRRDEGTKQRYTTSQYEAPEAIANLDSPRSRRYDIWSMGCIILEFVIVLLYGPDGLTAFYRERELGQASTDTLYFTLDAHNGPVHVSHIAKHWMEQILGNSECRRPEGSAISDLISLVRDRLLIVPLPADNMTEDQKKRCRADASELQRQLERMRGLALKRGDSYLLGEPARQHSSIPFPFSVQGPETRKEGQGYLKAPGPQAPWRELETYTHVPFDKAWNYPVDNEFAAEFLRDSLYNTNVFPLARLDVVLCENCAQASTWTSTSWIMRFEGEEPLNCRLHDLTLRACGLKPLANETTNLEVQRIGSNLFINGYSSPVLCLFKSPSPSAFYATPENAFSDIQTGFPDLQQVRDSMYFKLLSDWLRDCNAKHPQCNHGNSLKTPSSSARRLLPTKLIDVSQRPRSSRKDIDSVRLVVTARLSDHELHTDTRYMALSHPWGIRSQNNHFCTTRQNLTARIEDGILVATLPATLQDAVTVTRELGIRYLWIDTICIVQGPDGDFDTEARLMESVFSLAYCVIAASRASGTSSGFLSPRRSRDFIALKTSNISSSTTLYITTPLDDFQSDVIDGRLNKRGWVLQERALARRTIYFTASQTYFECGAGVRCETLTKMTNSQASFLGDPAFPTVALKSSKGAKIRLYELLYKTYSALHFTKIWDRPIAIAGLEQRLVWAFNTHGGYGVFDGQFFGRSLLWKRDEKAEENEVMKAIEFPVGDRRYYHVPTWSWMAYDGVIDFMDVPFDGVEWQHSEEEGVLSPWGRMSEQKGEEEVPHGDALWHSGKANERTVLSAVGRALAVPLEEAETKIVYDGGRDLRRGQVSEVGVVVVGRQKTDNKHATNVGVLQHYVLVVGQRQDSGTAYRRLGVARLPGSWIDQKGPGKKISIV